ncbi:RING finger -like protein [Halotydeus destructor]|nr:RING finger -like protein [Halotydeus destructor]
MSWIASKLVNMETSVGVILRTPGLFVIDYWWKHEKSRTMSMDGQVRRDFGTTLVTNLALLNGFLLLTLPISCIRSLYCHFVCGVLLMSAHFLSWYYVNMSDSNVKDDVTVGASSVMANIVAKGAEPSLANQMPLFAAQLSIAITVSRLLQGPQKPLLPILAVYSLPIVARMAHFPTDTLQILHNFSFALVGISFLRYAYYALPGVFKSLRGVYLKLQFVAEYHGSVAVATKILTKILVPTHFFLFWTIKFAVKSYELFSEGPAGQPWYVSVLSASAATCDSPVSLVATAVAVSYASCFVLTTIKLYLGSGPKIPALNQAGNQRLFALQQTHTGWEEGVTTFLLALLTGLTEMKQSSRMAVLTIIMFVVLSSLLQSMLEIAEPVILSLSAYHGRNVFHHIKVLSLCLFLFLFPLQVTYVLSQIFPVDFWMAVVLSTCLLTSAQILDLMVVHCLLWYDATRSEPWDPLDEVVYYVRGVTKIVEFFIATSVVIVGAIEGVSGQWSLTNALILIVHCYFNVWLRFQAGYVSFAKRRAALEKSAKLPSATSVELNHYNDVCAICFMDMAFESNSVVTPCNHYFHRVCLRRWLCFQNRCPLCSVAINFAEKTKPTELANIDENLNGDLNHPH